MASIASLPDRQPAGVSPDGPVLALDTGSPVTSVAIARPGGTVAERSSATRTSSAELLRMIDTLMADQRLNPSDLAAVIALLGPGSFTGLRVGLATALGLHQALGIAAGSLPSLQVLAACRPQTRGTVVAVVDALRGEWFAQPFAGGERPRPLAAATRLTPVEIAALEPVELVGFDSVRLTGAADGLVAKAHEPRALAPVALRLAAAGAANWDPARLTRPLYLRSAAARPRPPA